MFTCEGPRYLYEYSLGKALSLLILDCWQREYDKRPYKHFKFTINHFMERMERKFHNIKDFTVIVDFLLQRKLSSAKILGFRIEDEPKELLHDFVMGIKNLQCLTLKLMDLPIDFFQLLLQNVKHLDLVVLNLEGSKLERAVIPILQQILYKCPNLMELNVNDCDIQQYDFALLIDGVHKSPKVNRLHCNRLLGGHLSIESEKMMYLLAQLIWQNRLIELDIEKCNFNGQDMQIIAEYLGKRNCRLRKLNIANNIIGPDGAKHILHSITHSGSLIYLNMSGNAIGAHGAEHVSQCLSACGCLQYLIITYNEIPAVSINMILTSMKKPIMLKRLEMYGNSYDAYTGMVLRRLIEARVVPQSTIDITYTLDETGENYRIIPYREFRKPEM